LEKEVKNNSNNKLEPSNYKWGMFDYNKNDKRIFVDKPNPSYGTTLNFANPKAYLVLLIAVLFFGFILYKISFKSS